jgi:hypothetical protein
MVWLSNTVRPKLDTSSCTSTATKSISDYERGCTPLKALKLLDLDDPRHPFGVLERYKVVFERISFTELTENNRFVLGISSETEWDVKNNTSKRTLDPRIISNEDELVGFYEHYVLRPAAEMAKVVLASDQCPPELNGLLPYSVDVHSPVSISKVANPDRVVAICNARGQYQRDRDVALPTEGKLPSVLNDSKQQAIIRLATGSQKGWRAGLQRVLSKQQNQAAARIIIQVTLFVLPSLCLPFVGFLPCGLLRQSVLYVVGSYSHAHCISVQKRTKHHVHDQLDQGV